MLRYFAIARRNGQWIYICSGSRPEEIYHEAITIIQAQEHYREDEDFAITPAAESMLDTLRVVPEETAKEHYHLTYPRYAQVED